MAVKEKIRIRLQSYDAQLIDAAAEKIVETAKHTDRKSTRLNSSHNRESRMPSSA